jgi:hypothetical protein
MVAFIPALPSPAFADAQTPKVLSLQPVFLFEVKMGSDELHLSGIIAVTVQA